MKTSKDLTNDEVLELWADYDKCPDFTPILKALLKERTHFKRGIALLIEARQYLALLSEFPTDSTIDDEDEQEAINGLHTEVCEYFSSIPQQEALS